MMWTDDPVKDAERYYNEQEARIKKLPKCSECKCHIQDEYAYYINDEWICEGCMEENHKRDTEDFIKN